MKSKNSRNEMKKEKISLSLKISEIKEDIAGKERQNERLQANIEEAERELVSIQKRLNYIQEFNSQVDDGTKQRLAEFKMMNEELGKKHNQLFRLRSEISSNINDSLQPRRRRFIDEYESLDVNKIQKQLETILREHEIAKSDYTDASSLAEELESQINEITNEINNTEDDITKLQRAEDQVSTKLTNAKNNIERILASISLLQQRHEECVKQQKDIGALPETEIEEFQGQSHHELMRHLSNINQEYKRYRHVNKKAIEQHRSFTQQQVELTARQEELQSSKESISNLIQTLDKRKEQAIAKTFAQVSENFTQILSELEPNAHGQLVLQRDEETNEYIGVTIRVQFEDQDVVSLAQLSGGQKALIALTLVFAIQKYAPAPFYLFDEVDSALDDKYRLAVSKLMNRVCKPDDKDEAAQIIFTTFKKELLEDCDKYFAVKYDRGHSTSMEINEEAANNIIVEQNDNE